MDWIRSLVRVMTTLICLSAPAVLAEEAGETPFSLVSITASESDPGTSGVADRESFQSDYRDPHRGWTVDVGTIILQRSRAKAALLAEDATTGDELSNVRDFGMGFRAGPIFELTRNWDLWDIGVRFFTIDSWRATRALSDTGNLQVPLVSTSSSDVFDTLDAGYTSQLYSTEISVKRRLNDAVRILGGFRVVELHEVAFGTAYSPSLEGNMHLQTANYLCGFQLGSEATLWNRGGPLSVEGFLKAGVYGNHVKMNIQGRGTHFYEDIQAAGNTTSFLGEIGLTAKYRLNPHWSLTGGYQLMWLDNVLLAPDFIAAMYGTTQTMANTAFYHGALIGVEAAW